jgi:hypothetical protein
MLRRVAIVSFALAAAFVAACGHQVTPEPSVLNSDLTGKIDLRFSTSGSLNFTTYTYAIIIDTCGGGVPYPNTFATSFNNYSYGFLIGGRYGSVASPQLFQYYVSPNSNGNIAYLSKPLDPTTIQFNPNSNGQGNQFEIIFDRSLLDNPFNVAQPCPNLTPQPSGAPTPSAAPTGASTPSASPAPSPTATQPGATPNPQATTVAQATWLFNFFSIDQNNRVVDSLGINGPTDTTYNGDPIDTTSLDFVQIFRPAGSYVASDPSAALTGGEIDNYP